MDQSRLSLMTFPMDIDLFKKTMSIRDVLELAQRAGIPNVDVMNVREGQIPQYLEAMKETGVRVYTYITQISFLRSEKRWNKAIRTSLETAKLLNAKYLMIVPYGFPDWYRARKIGRAAVKQHMIDGFRKAVEMGRLYGIHVCFETTPHDASCLSGTQDCLDVLNAVDGLEFVFDTANMLPHGDDPLEAYEALKDRISHVHLKDVVLEQKPKVFKHSEHTPDGKLMRCVIWGEGIIPVCEIYRRMIADGYTGQFAIEYVHPEGKYDLEGHIPQINKFLEKVHCWIRC